MALAFPIAVGVSVVCFALVYIAPGDPLETVVPSDATAATIAVIKHAYGFDKPLAIQYLIWLGRVLHGNLGISIATNRPVSLEVGEALVNTLRLVALAMPAALIIGYAMGVAAARYPGRMLDRIVSGLAMFGISLPNYWVGVVLVIVFAVQWPLLPATGMAPIAPGSIGMFNWSDLRFMILPAISLALIPTGIIARSTRAAVLDVLSQDFVLTLRAKGLDEEAITRHVLRNALPQVIAVVALQFGYLMGGSILVETVFSWPGTGYLLGYAIQNRDVPLLQGIVLVLSMIFVVTNLIADLLQVRVDPRLRRG
ncbi:MAG TPA: ABC transporter permease [Acidocella sp.]|uniref:ABC transporter permease n=1 Tax=Acidocella sp. TaxID=50710 RepID=UPI002B5E6227|nr:ABC transporter permease [Acidocella sp.]HVE22081.1 ABC transporter permease [Acidocella sp.]